MSHLNGAFHVALCVSKTHRTLSEEGILSKGDFQRKLREFNNVRYGSNRSTDYLSTVYENAQAETELDARVHQPVSNRSISPLTPLSPGEAPLMEKIKQLNAVLYRKRASPSSGRKTRQPTVGNNNCGANRARWCADACAKLEELVADLDRKIGRIAGQMDSAERLKEIQKEWGQMARVVERIFLSMFVVGTAVFVYVVTATAMPPRFLPTNCTVVDVVHSDDSFA
uniref:Neurotransmitter-gated ion-channel transmembrane domain-containing protein n=1 Tax=Plectus sambesii TaxID=2011161 RepID=A0A914VM65_9BILA